MLSCLRILSEIYFWSPCGTVTFYQQKVDDKWGFAATQITQIFDATGLTKLAREWLDLSEANEMTKDI